MAGRVVGAGVAADQVQTGDRHEQLVAAGVFQGQKLGGQAACVYMVSGAPGSDRPRDPGAPPAGPWVSSPRFRITASELRFLFLSRWRLLDLAAEQLGFGDEGKGRLAGLLQQEAPQGQTSSPWRSSLERKASREANSRGCRVDPCEQIPSPSRRPRTPPQTGCARQSLAGSRQGASRGCSLLWSSCRSGRGRGQIVLTRSTVSGRLLQPHGAIVPEGGEELLHRQIDLLGRQQGTVLSQRLSS